MGKQMIIRKMTDEDITSVAVLDSYAFNTSWSEKAFKDEIDKDYSYYYVCTENDAIIGYIGIWCIYETAELIRIAVLPETQGKGIGSELLKTALAKAKEQGCERMMLEVRAGNIHARNLYEKYNFKEISIRRGYYNGEDAHIMEMIY